METNVISEKKKELQKFRVTHVQLAFFLLSELVSETIIFLMKLGVIYSLLI